MKTFGKYFNWKIEKPHYTKEEKENLFLELAHLDELEIGFNLIFNKYVLYYYYNDVCLFGIDKKEKDFNIYHELWNNIEDKFDMDKTEIFYFLSDMTSKYFYDYRFHRVRNTFFG